MRAYKKEGQQEEQATRLPELLLEEGLEQSAPVALSCSGDTASKGVECWQILEHPGEQKKKSDSEPFTEYTVSAPTPAPDY